MKKTGKTFIIFILSACLVFGLADAAFADLTEDEITAADFIDEQQNDIGDRISDQLSGNETTPGQLSENETTPDQLSGNDTTSDQLQENGATSEQQPGSGTTPGQLSENETTPDQLSGNDTTSDQLQENGTTSEQQPGSGTTPEQQPGNDTATDQLPGNETTPNQLPGDEILPGEGTSGTDQDVIQDKEQELLSRTYDEEIVGETSPDGSDTQEKIESANANISSKKDKKTKKTDITNIAAVTLAKSKMTYTGKARTQTKKIVVTITSEDGTVTTLTRKTDYEVSYRNNIEVGTAVVIITGIGKYTGQAEATFQIVPEKTSLTSVRASTGKITARWKKQAVSTDGYQLQYSIKKDFSSKRRTLTIENIKTVAKTVSGLKPGKRYFVRVRTYKTVSGVKYFSAWSDVKTAVLVINKLKITGSGTTRTAMLYNPAETVASAKLSVWSKEGEKDDLKTYTMSKTQDGSFKVLILGAYLKHSGTCWAECASGGTVIADRTFSITKAEYEATQDTILVLGTGSVRTIKVLHPSAAKNMKAGIWSEEGKQDDLTWTELKKMSDGSWSGQFYTAALNHGGTINVHIYANDNTEFLNSRTFTYKLGYEPIPWNSSWEFASYSKVHTGTAKLYRAEKNRKNIVVGVNAGHGTILPAGQDNYVYSHPDKTPKTTGGSTAAGSVFTICDNTGMCFNDGTLEAQVTLDQAMILKDVLLDAGYDVIMIRENHDSGLDVIARTVICNELADCHISLHWDGDGLSYDKGIFYMSVADGIKNMYPTSTIWQKSNRFGDCLIQGLQKQNLTIFEGGSMQMDLMQTSYSKVPSIDIELGNQSSTHTTSDLKKRAEGMLEGINLFFDKK